MKILYIIPGFGENSKMVCYKKIISLGKKHGFHVIPINIKWQRTTMTQWLEQCNLILKKHVKRYTDAQIVMLGFSFGSCLAIHLAQTYNFHKLILCSISPYFKQDLKKLPPIVEKILGKKRMVDFSKYPFPKNNFTPAIFLYGSSEWPLTIKANKQYYKYWSGKKVIHEIPNAEHTIDSDAYRQAIEKSIK